MILGYLEKERKVLPKILLARFRDCDHNVYEILGICNTAFKTTIQAYCNNLSLLFFIYLVNHTQSVTRAEIPTLSDDSIGGS